MVTSSIQTHTHDCATTKEYIERLASKFTAEGCDVSLEHWPSPNVQLSVTIMNDTYAFKVLLHRNDSVYNLSTQMRDAAHREFFMESFRIPE